MIRSLTQTSTIAALFFGLVFSVASAHATRGQLCAVDQR